MYIMRYILPLPLSNPHLPFIATVNLHTVCKTLNFLYYTSLDKSKLGLRCIQNI